MKESSDIFQDQQILKRILKFSQIKKTQLYIVGGFLRDIILGRGRNNPDIDFAIKKNAIKFAAGLSKRLKAGFVVLDKTNGCARLVKKIDNKVYTLDFADFRGKDLWQDLSKRDFSINTLAVELRVFLKGQDTRNRYIPRQFINLLIDPYQGLRDLKLFVKKKS